MEYFIRSRNPESPRGVHYLGGISFKEGALFGTGVQPVVVVVCVSGCVLSFCLAPAGSASSRTRTHPLVHR